MLEWQPLTWYIFHTITLNYNNAYRDEYIKFFNSFKSIIPCKECKEHFNKNITKPELSVESNINEERIFNWTVDLHNSVNKKNHVLPWTYDKAKQYYTQNNFNNQKYKLFLLEFVKHNFRKGPEKTDNLINMLKTLPYFHPNESKRNKLIEFSKRFELNRQTMRQWLISFILILEKNPMVV